MTDVGVIPEDWEVKSIGEICCDTKYGVAAEAIPFDGINKYIRITDIDDEDGHFVQSNLTSPSFFMPIHILGENDLLIARTGASVGKSYLYNKQDGKLIFAGFLMKFNINKANPKLVFYKTMTSDYHDYIESESMRSGQPGVNIQQIKDYTVSLPKAIKEQQAIADALTKVDDLIMSLSKVIEKKKLIKKGAMQKLLSGEMRLDGFDVEWERKRIGKIGITYSGITGKNKSDFGHGTAKYITFLNVLNNPIINTKELELVDISSNENQNKAVKGDLFFNVSSETPEEVGICSVLLDDISNLYVNSFCFGFRITDKEVSGIYLSYLFRTSLGRDKMSSIAQGATRYNLSKDYFNEIELTIPPTKAEQTAIANVLTTMDDEIEALEKERDKYKCIKQGMMQQLLTGKIRLTCQ